MRKPIVDLAELRRLVEAERPCEVEQGGLSSGFQSLDGALRWGGFPRGGVVAICGEAGTGRMTIAAHVLANETARGRAVAWIDAEQSLYPPALDSIGVQLSRLLIVRTRDRKGALLAMQHIMESRAFSVAVCSGVDEALTPVRAKRLQMATSGSSSCAFLLLENAQRAQSHVALRLSCRRKDGVIVVEIEKSQGGAPAKRIALSAF